MSIEEYQNFTTTYAQGFYEGENKWKCKIKEKIEYLDNQQRQWLEDRELKDTDEEICYARDVLIKLLKEEE